MNDQKRVNIPTVRNRFSHEHKPLRNKVVFITSTILHTVTYEPPALLEEEEEDEEEDFLAHLSDYDSQDKSILRCGKPKIVYSTHEGC